MDSRHWRIAGRSRRYRNWLGLGLSLFCLVAPGVRAEGLPPAAARRVDFKADVEPLFKRCLACHGEAQQLNGLRLDRKADALRGGHSGPSIIPGNGAGSRLIHLVAGYQVKFVMPPAGERLSADEIGILRAWIDQGAEWPDSGEGPKKLSQATKPKHWAYQPVGAIEPPAVRERSWARNAIDRFVLARLEPENIAPSPEADRTTLLRRVSLDLTGVPPTPEQVSKFLADNRPAAYEQLVEELLRSPHYGEKWAMHWLDQVRYADSDGYEKDDPRPHAWRYRQWVIDALNRDQPFDEFTVEQIAGDLLPNATTEQKVATGFHRNTLRNREGGVNFEQFRFEENVDRVNTVSSVWLGMTTGCAQCHDHKYDPIKQSDYYRFFAFFDNMDIDLIPAPMPGEMGPYLKTHDEYRLRRDELLCEYRVPELQAPWEEKVKYHGQHPGEDTGWDVNWDTLAKMTDGGDQYILIPSGERTERQRDVVTDYFIRFYGQVVDKERYKQLGFAELRKKLAVLEAQFPQISRARVVFEDPEPRKSHLHVRGQWDRLGVEVQPGVPEFLPQLDAGKANRLDLARWIVSGENPLTARVIVNRVWQEYFGRGLVSTSDDFGTQGAKPTHPELLDWLATDLVQSGWSLKSLHKRIVMSATYRQSSDARPEISDRDPGNELLARQSRLRLSAELIRDSALAAGGLLSTKVGGPSVKPPIPDGVTNLGYADGFEWKTSRGPDAYRRGLYIHFQRTVPYPFLMTFDAAERNVTECSRDRSNTPLQALNLLNDPVFMEAAQGLASRVLLEAPADDFAGRLDYGYRLCFGRGPSASEQARLREYFAAQKKLIDESPGSAEHWFPAKLEGVDRNESAAWAGLARVLLNLDEFVTRE